MKSVWSPGFRVIPPATCGGFSVKRLDVRERHLEKQTGERFWAIFAENALFEEGMMLVPAWTIERFRDEAKLGKCVWQAETIEELAVKLGLPSENLTETVSEFNKYIKLQKDEKFGRIYLQNSVSKAPFYALLTYASSLVSCGGLAVNTDLQVVEKGDNPIANLYAIGEIIGAGAMTGNAFCSGMLVTPALSFGRILGRNLSNQN